MSDMEQGKPVHPDHNNHCWHQFRGVLLMVLPDEYTVQKCCECQQTRTVHVDHVYVGRR